MIYRYHWLLIRFPPQKIWIGFYSFYTIKNKRKSIDLNQITVTFSRFSSFSSYNNCAKNVFQQIRINRKRFCICSWEARRFPIRPQLPSPIWCPESSSDDCFPIIALESSALVLRYRLGRSNYQQWNVTVRISFRLAFERQSVSLHRPLTNHCDPSDVLIECLPRWKIIGK